MLSSETKLSCIKTELKRCTNDWESLEYIWHLAQVAECTRQAFAKSGKEGQRTGTERAVGFHCDWLKDIRVGGARIFRLFTTGSEACCRACRLSRRRQKRSCHGINIMPSGLLPSSLVKPTGSFVTGVPADCMARATTSFSAWYLIILLGACLQTKPWSPWASTNDPHRQECGTHTLHPRHRYSHPDGLIRQPKTACRDR